MSIRPGKYIEYDFPLHAVNRLAVKEAPVGGRRPIYHMHKWWARRLSCVFRTILLASAIEWEDWDRLESWETDSDGDFVDTDGQKIIDVKEYHRRVRRSSLNTAWERLYYQLDDEANAVIEKAFRGKTILDPFMGGGTTIVEAMRLGANVVGVDLNPVAWFTVKKETDGCDLAALDAAFEQIEREVGEDFRSYYKTRCPECGEEADAIYTFWVKLGKCGQSDCETVVPLLNSYVVARDTANHPIAPSATDRLATARDKSNAKLPTAAVYCPWCSIVYEDLYVAPPSEEKGAHPESVCPECARTLRLDKGNAGDGGFDCTPGCGQKTDVIEGVRPLFRRPDGPPTCRMYALKCRCQSCGFAGFVAASEEDRARYERAENEFERVADALGLPDQAIPPGYNTLVGNDLWMHGYKNWTDLFNSRQLLLLAKLRDAVLRVPDTNIREYLLTAWSGTLDYSNTFCTFEPGTQNQQNIFKSHAYIPVLTYSENNVFGIEADGKGNFLRQVNKVRDALKFWLQPYNTWVDAKGKTSKRPSPNAARLNVTNRELLCRSSEDLPGTLARAAAVVTDPPYCDNVMYGELSDFFHVWLYWVLKDTYPDVYHSPYTPKDEEILDTLSRLGNGFLPDAKTPHRYSGLIPVKDQSFFSSGLTRCFREAGGHLVDDGVLVFTFHHQANEAWGSVLQTVMDAGFYIRAVYPVHAENLYSTHIQDKKNISYDAVIICRKQETEPPRAEWRDIEDRVFVRAEQLVRELEQRTNGNRLAPEDIYVIAIGKCMEEYSKHYFKGQPYVFKGGQPVGIEEALNGDEDRGIRGIGEIVDQLVEEAEGRMWPAGLDPISRFYVVNFLGQSEVPYDRLHRRLRHNVHITLDELEKRHLVKQTKGKVKVLTEKEREDYLLAIYSDEEPEQATFDLGLPEITDLTYMDKVHLLAVLDQQGVMTGGLFADFSKDATFVDLVKQIGNLLDASAKGYTFYRDLAGQVTGQGRMEL